MKILTVNTSDMHGGAARAAYRLHSALLEQSIESEMLVLRKTSDDYTVKSVIETKLTDYITQLYRRLDYNIVQKRSPKGLFSIAKYSSKTAVRKINEAKADVVHLHWVNGGMLSLEDIEKIKGPIVWSLHDNWAFTGGCHVKWKCDKYMAGCSCCPLLNTNKSTDLSYRVFKRKEKVFSKIKNLTIVGLSRWLYTLSKESILLKSKKHFNLPNPINTIVFKPLNSQFSRELWSLPQDKKLVLFGAMNTTSDKNKGYLELLESLGYLKLENIELVVFGCSKPEDVPDLGFSIHYVGRLQDDVSLVSLYSAVDVMVVPSLQENLSNAIMESLSCGTPVVAFDIGGNSDMIIHQKNGYLAKPFDTSALAKGIEWVIENNNYEDLCNNAREKVVREFDNTVVAKKYIDLYESII